MKIAVAQIKCELGDVAANCARMESLAAQARKAGCSVVVFPEMSDTGYEIETIKARACKWPGLPYATLKAAAARHQIHIIAGISERVGKDIYNTSAVFSPRGRLLGKYRKAHLFPVFPVCEDRHIKAGKALTTVKIEGVKVGLFICYDLRFPELARALTLRGAEVLVVIAAWQFPRVSHWTTLLSARAIENQTYVVAANRVGTDGPTTFCGSSRIIDPYGVIVASAAEDRDELIIGEIKPDVIQWARNRMPVLKHRREDVYRS
jgi:omega-amidase